MKRVVNMSNELNPQVVDVSIICTFKIKYTYWNAGEV